MPRSPDIIFRDELDALDLPTRVKTMLRRAGVHDIAELEDLYERDFMSLFSIPGIGDRSLAHIQHALDGYYGRPPGYRQWQARAALERVNALLRGPR